MTDVRRVAVVGGHGKTGRDVAAALTGRGAEAVATGRAEWDRLGEVLAGCHAAYVVAPNLHPDEPAYESAPTGRTVAPASDAPTQTHGTSTRR